MEGETMKAKETEASAPAGVIKCGTPAAMGEVHQIACERDGLLARIANLERALETSEEQIQDVTRRFSADVDTVREGLAAERITRMEAESARDSAFREHNAMADRLRAVEVGLQKALGSFFRTNPATGDFYTNVLEDVARVVRLLESVEGFLPSDVDSLFPLPHEKGIRRIDRIAVTSAVRKLAQVALEKCPRSYDRVSGLRKLITVHAALERSFTENG